MKSVAKQRMIYQTDETRTKILTVARTLFTERGLFDTQMLDVAEALGMSRTTLYRYFQDKLDLALSIASILMAEIQEAWHDPGPGPGRTARDRVGLYLQQVWANTEGYSAHLRFFAEFDAFFSGARIPEGFREKIAALIPDGGKPVLLALVTEAQADGSIRPGLDAHLTMATLLNTVRGLQQRVGLRGDVLVEVRPHEANHLIDEALSYLMRGLAP
jgi:AcrR family transcriptional regulator